MSRKKEEIQMIGNVGTYRDENNLFTFQIGSDPLSAIDPDDPFIQRKQMGFAQWLRVNDYNVMSRGCNNTQCEEIEQDIKHNRLLPRLINKQINMLYGTGPAIYRSIIQDGKRVKLWEEQKVIMDWLEQWQENGMEQSYTDFAQTIIKNFYYFRDYFVKWRFSLGAAIGKMPIAGLEVLENKHCRLATNRTDVATTQINYKDFRQVLVGNWVFGPCNYQVYPKFDIREVANYRFAAVSHHREKSVGDFYGLNETHAGTREYIKGSNQTAEYINSFYKNSLAAKIHIIIPNAWVESKRKQLQALCEENARRKKEGLALITYGDIEIGTTYSESYIMQVIQQETRKLSEYLSGARNQGKAYVTTSFRTGQNGQDEERWRIETVDLKYKEYIESLITYDKRADEVLLSSVGLDSSISSVSKDGIISKSGSDVYYNYLLYILSLTPDDEKCSEPFNMAIKINFPSLYAAGYRIGYYREVPSRQEDVSPNDRLNKQQS